MIQADMYDLNKIKSELVTWFLIYIHDIDVRSVTKCTKS